MALTDPELDLLREMLEDDPADEAFLQVGEELVRRSRWAEAEEVLTRGLAPAPDERGFELLARASLETGRFDLALSALQHLDRDPVGAPENARVQILVLERSGRLDDARAHALAFLERDPNDVVVQAVIERLDAPPPSQDQRAADPFYTVQRAEQYVRIGRPDRAVRVYRRIQLANMNDEGLSLRVRQLGAAPLASGGDDLSEELTDPGDVPAEPSIATTTEGAPPRTIDMPLPSISTATPVHAQPREVTARTPSYGGSRPPVAVGASEHRPPNPIEPELPTERDLDLSEIDQRDPDDEDTDLNVFRVTDDPKPDDEVARPQRRRRRSLIRK